MFRSILTRATVSIPAQARGLKYVNTSKAPSAVGPYSQAVSHGNMIFVSGQLPLDPSTGKFVEPKAGESVAQAQTKKCLENMKAILEEGGSSMSQVMKTTILLADIGTFADVNGVYATFFTAPNLPARATFAVKDLPMGAQVEIECVATTDKN